ncbi:MAG: hypothetical protein U5L76_04800 [Patescibacteria group bacterium]|nr:hypothetical protein [Patescibacteria group bacterium]
MKSKFKERVSIWKILIWARWLVFKETVKYWFRWLKRRLSRKIWTWQLKGKFKKSDKDDYTHYIIR